MFDDIDAISKLINSGILTTLLVVAIKWAPNAAKAMLSRYDAVLTEHQRMRETFVAEQQDDRHHIAGLFQQMASTIEARMERFENEMRRTNNATLNRMDKLATERSEQMSEFEKRITAAIQRLDRCDEEAA